MGSFPCLYSTWHTVVYYFYGWLYQDDLVVHNKNKKRCSIDYMIRTQFSHPIKVLQLDKDGVHVNSKLSQFFQENDILHGLPSSDPTSECSSWAEKYTHFRSCTSFSYLCISSSNLLGWCSHLYHLFDQLNAYKGPRLPYSPGGISKIMCHCFLHSIFTPHIFVSQCASP